MKTDEKYQVKDKDRLRKEDSLEERISQLEPLKT